MKDYNQLKEEFYRDAFWASPKIDVDGMWNWISTKLQEVEENTKREVDDYWINQPANEHDNRIRREAVEGFGKFTTRNGDFLNSADGWDSWYAQNVLDEIDEYNKLNGGSK